MPRSCTWPCISTRCCQTRRTVSAPRSGNFSNGSTSPRSRPRRVADAYNPAAHAFAPLVYDGYSGEVGILSLAANLAGQVDIAALYHSDTNRAAFSAVGGSTSYVMHSSSDHQAPFMQWLLPLFVDVSGYGPDSYPVPALAANPRDNAVRYQQDVTARLAAAGRGAWLQPDAGNDWRGVAADYHQYSVFQDFGQPSLFMPWSLSFGFLADPATAGTALPALLTADLHGPFGPVDSAYWDTGAAAPRDVAARSDLWDASLSLLAFTQYLYGDNQYLTAAPDVAAALRQVFLASSGLSPAAEFVLDAANAYCPGSDSAAGSTPAVPLYTDFQAGGDYVNINDVARLTLDGNDPDAGEGRSSLRATWSGGGVNGYFQFGFGNPGPRHPRVWIRP